MLRPTPTANFSRSFGSRPGQDSLSTFHPVDSSDLNRTLRERQMFVRKTDHAPYNGAGSALSSEGQRGRAPMGKVAYSRLPHDPDPLEHS